MRFVRNFLATVALCASAAATATTIAVIDSGVDYKHKDLAEHIWANPGEIPDNNVDDDKNGYVDDYRGWNFAEDSKEVIDYSHLGTFSKDCYKFFEVQGRVLKGTATSDDQEWLAQKKTDQMFLQELMKFGNFVHGTHVSGIASSSRTVEKIMALKIIATGNHLRREMEHLIAVTPHDDDDDSPLTKALVTMLLDGIVNRNAEVVVKAGTYAVDQKAQVANGSFGLNHGNIENVVKMLLKMVLKHEPKEETVKKYTTYVMDKFNDKMREFTDKAQDTLFVFAAGNEGTNNDEKPVAPANVGGSNTMSVAATLGLSKLPSFSNYGKGTVDVAAPGVAIKSTIPGNEYLELSGTSMAAPYVSYVAALVKNANGALKAADVKRVIMETSDTKDFLKDKVKCGGIVNVDRAVLAAKQSRLESLSEAIAEARTKVADQRDQREYLQQLDERELFVVPLPDPLHFD